MAFNPAKNTNFEIQEAVYENKASLYLSGVIITHRIRIKLIHTNETNPRTSRIASHRACYHWIAAALRSATRHTEVSRSKLKPYCNDAPSSSRDTMCRDDPENPTAFYKAGLPPGVRLVVASKI